MSVLGWSLLEGRRGKTTLSGTKLVRTYNATFQVITDDHWDDESDIEAYIEANTGMPKWFSPHPTNAYALLNDREIIQQSKGQDGRVWHVNCGWTDDINPGDAEKSNPVEFSARIEYRSQKRKRVIWVDKDGKASVNTAKCLIDPPLEVDVSGAIITATVNQATFSFAADIKPVENHVNQNAIWGAEAGTLKVTEVSAQDAWSQGIHYFVVKRVIEYNEDGWKEKPLSRGIMEIKNDKLVRIKDENKQDITEPVPLDATGAKIPASSLPGGAYYLEFRVCDGYDFSQFPWTA